ncbi:hypothetical protein K6119_02565 [Paracrocinitomix mangrovi]|uniref:hypothetical protein n=1 Tax=Paracrocinitomix mangrovi TaxID=2862509 RepID=UPI001C8D226F|nr:hypothetical protein [Paracrocinitomix mangrovi]UKN02402.1 hypothetical protein K6119_02565 [Paracrocinitomix mangrovi]
MTFPQFRKYKGINTWFKIEAKNQFTEIKKVGNQFQIHEVIAEQYPEKLMIQDMLNCYEDRWEEISEEEYLAIEKGI